MSRTLRGVIKRDTIAPESRKPHRALKNAIVPGGAKRYNTGKIRYDLIPTPLLESTARVLEYGATKYEKNNWLKGMQYSTVIGSLKRHLAKIEIGEDLDEESGYPHVAHMICNCLMLEHYRNMGWSSLDDRPKTYFAKDAKN